MAVRRAAPASRQVARNSTKGDAPKVAHETVTPPNAGGPATAGAAPASGTPPEKKSSNLMIGAVLVGAVAASYYVTIDKMKGQDFLGDAEKEAAEEAQVNLHKSGLKVSSKVVPEQVEQAFSSAKDAASEAAKKVGDAAGVVAEKAGVVAEKAGEVAENVKSAVGDVTGATSAAKEEAEAEAEAAAKAVAEALEAEKPKKKGWRKYIIFGPRREG
eukprot:g5826.t1